MNERSEIVLSGFANTHVWLDVLRTNFLRDHGQRGRYPTGKMDAQKRMRQRGRSRTERGRQCQLLLSETKHSASADILVARNL
jgi:urease accessory protein UreE